MLNRLRAWVLRHRRRPTVVPWAAWGKDPDGTFVEADGDGFTFESPTTTFGVITHCDIWDSPVGGKFVDRIYLTDPPDA